MSASTMLSERAIADCRFKDMIWNDYCPTTDPDPRLPTDYLTVVHRELGVGGAGGKAVPPDPVLAENLLRARPETEHDPDALLALGLSLARQDRHEDALTTYNRAFNVYRRWGAKIETNVSASLIECRRYEEACVAARAALSVNVESSSAWSNLFYSLVKLGHRTELEKALHDLDTLVPGWTTMAAFVKRVTADVIVLLGRNDPLSKQLCQKFGG
jgi:tetratricopeptide (TPR) repeat protein